MRRRLRARHLCMLGMHKVIIVVRVSIIGYAALARQVLGRGLMMQSEGGYDADCVTSVTYIFVFG